MIYKAVVDGREFFIEKDLRDNSRETDNIAREEIIRHYLDTEGAEEVVISEVGYDEFFAGERCGYKASGNVKKLEDEFMTGSMRVWGKVVARTSDDELAVLAGRMSDTGRHLILAGIADERINNLVRKTMALGDDACDGADETAARLLDEWRAYSSRLKSYS